MEGGRSQRGKAINFQTPVTLVVLIKYTLIHITTTPMVGARGTFTQTIVFVLLADIFK